MASKAGEGSLTRNTKNHDIECLSESSYGPGSLSECAMPEWAGVMLLVMETLAQYSSTRSVPKCDYFGFWPGNTVVFFLI